MMSGGAWALVLSLAIQAAHTPAHIQSAAFDVMQAARYCTLITNGADGQPQARMVDPLLARSEGKVYIATSPLTRKVGELKADPRVTLMFFNAAQGEYVTVIGRAAVMTDQARMAAHWKAEWAPFYKEMTKGADFMLVEVTPSRLEISSQRLGMDGDPKTWRPVVLDLPQPKR